MDSKHIAALCALRNAKHGRKCQCCCKNSLCSSQFYRRFHRIQSFHFILIGKIRISCLLQPSPLYPIKVNLSSKSRRTRAEFFYPSKCVSYFYDRDKKQLLIKNITKAVYKISHSFYLSFSKYSCNHIVPLKIVSRTISLRFHWNARVD